MNLLSYFPDLPANFSKNITRQHELEINWGKPNKPHHFSWIYTLFQNAAIRNQTFTSHR